MQCCNWRWRSFNNIAMPRECGGFTALNKSPLWAWLHEFAVPRLLPQCSFHFLMFLLLCKLTILYAHNFVNVFCTWARRACQCFWTFVSLRILSYKLLFNSFIHFDLLEVCNHAAVVYRLIIYRLFYMLYRVQFKPHVYFLFWSNRHRVFSWQSI